MRIKPLDKLVILGTIKPSLNSKIFFHGCQLVHLDNLKAKNIVIKINPFWLCNLAKTIVLKINQFWLCKIA